jgi:hypothetical protein
MFDTLGGKDKGTKSLTSLPSQDATGPQPVFDTFRAPEVRAVTPTDKVEGSGLRRFGKAVTDVVLTGGSFVLTEASAHFVAALAEVPNRINPVLHAHNPWVLTAEIAGSYVPVVIAQKHQTEKAVLLDYAGKPTINKLATFARSWIRNRYPNRPKVEAIGEQVIGAALPLGMEAYWWAGAGAATLLTNFPHGAAVIVGANAGGWMSMNLQNDLAEYNLRNGIEPSKGIKNKLKAVPRAAGGIARMKLDKNVARALWLKDKITLRTSHSPGPALAEVQGVADEIPLAEGVAVTPVPNTVPHQKGA